MLECENINVNLVEEEISIDLVEESIEVSLDGSCICLPGGGGAETSCRYEHDGTLSIGDLVYKPSNTDNVVLKAENNNTVNPVIGIVTRINSGTEVTVTHLGFFDVSVPLTQGKNIFVSETGGITTELVTTFYLQVLGVAISPSRIFFNPHLQRSKRLEV